MAKTIKINIGTEMIAPQTCQCLCLLGSLLANAINMFEIIMLLSDNQQIAKLQSILQRLSSKSFHMFFPSVTSLS